MNTQQWKNFVTVADCRSITRAAQELLIAQPALSLQIKTLESAVKAQLFLRKPRSVELTEAGKAFYRTAKHILQLEENMQTEIANITSGNEGVLKLGFTPSYPDAFIQSLLETYSSFYPNISYELYEQNSNELLSHLETGIIEIALIRSSFPLPPIFEEVCTYLERLYAFFPEGLSLPASSEEGIAPSSLTGVPLCIPRGLSNAIIGHFRQNGIDPLICSVCSSRSMTLEMARITNTVGLLSVPNIGQPASFYSAFSRIPIEDHRFTIKRSLVTYRGRTLSFAAQNLISLLQS